MKILLTLVLGILSGVLLAFAFLYNNPITMDSMTPLDMSGNRQIVLNYSVVPDDAIVFTNSAESRARPSPQKVEQLWEAPIRQTSVLVTEMHDYRGTTVGVGVKFSSLSEETRLLNNEAIVNSAWHIVLPRHGTIQIGQTENYWGYLRDVVVPAHWSSADNWKGTWRGLLSTGPNALGTAHGYGGSGRFRGVEFEAVEYLTTSAYSASEGPVAADGQLIIELPSEQTRVAGAGEP